MAVVAVPGITVGPIGTLGYTAALVKVAVLRTRGTLSLLWARTLLACRVTGLTALTSMVLTENAQMCALDVILCSQRPGM